MAHLDDVLQLLEPKAWDRTVVCHPDDESRLHEGFEAVPSVHIRLIPNRFVERGKCIVIDDEALDGLTVDLGYEVWDAGLWRESRLR